MTNDIEALKARLLSDADYLEKIYGPGHQIVADLRQAATALDALSARIQELEGALRPFADAIRPDDTTISGWRFGTPAKHEHFVAARSALRRNAG